MIPTAALPHEVTIEAAAGTTGGGAPAYGEPVTVRARVVGKRRQVRTSTGVDIIASATATIRPGPTVPAGSLLTHGADLYEVVDTATAVELRRPHSVELILDGPRPAPPEPEPEPEPEP